MKQADEDTRDTSIKTQLLRLLLGIVVVFIGLRLVDSVFKLGSGLVAGIQQSRKVAAIQDEENKKKAAAWAEKLNRLNIVDYHFSSDGRFLVFELDDPPGQQELSGSAISAAECRKPETHGRPVGATVRLDQPALCL